MMKKSILKKIALATTSVAAFSINAQDLSNHPLSEYLAKPGAMVTMPVSAAKENFEPSFVQGAFDSFESFHAQMGGDHTLYYLTNWSTFMRTDMVKPHALQIELERNINKEISDIVVKTDSEGGVKMDDYFKHPTFRHQGVMMIHKGKVVYEAYPGMKPTDTHIWMSASKSITGLVVAMLVEEGKLDLDAPSHSVCNGAERDCMG